MLVRAVNENDKCRVIELLIMGADPNYSYRHKGLSCNLFKVCIQLKLIDIFKTLLCHGAIINATMKNELLDELDSQDEEFLAVVKSIEPVKTKSKHNLSMQNMNQ